MYRRYEEAVMERHTERERFRHQQRRGRRRHRFSYPLQLQTLPDFSEWISEEVRREQQSGVAVSPMVVDSSRGPLEVAATYKSIYAYGNHFRVLSSERSLKTMDSGIAATFRQTCRNGMRDVNQVEADVEYVGHIEEILELNYRRHCVVVLVCDFVKANYRGENATIKKDKWGFTLANYNRRPGIVCRDSFVFPKHCEQVFYCNARESPGWKIVLRKEVRGKRVLPDNIEANEPELFRMGEDDDFEGLCPQREVGEGPSAAVNTGQDIVLEEVLRQRTHRTVLRTPSRGRGRGNQGARGRGRAASRRGGLHESNVGRYRGRSGLGSGMNNEDYTSVVDEDRNEEELLYTEHAERGEGSGVREIVEERTGQRKRTRQQLETPENVDMEEEDQEGGGSSRGTASTSSTASEEDDYSSA